MTSTTYAKRAGAEFTRRLEELGVVVDDDPVALGRRAALAVAAEQAWESEMDGLLTSAEARMLLGGISREALRKQVSGGRILALRDDRGLVRYPAWQFDPDAGRAHPEVAEVAKRFADAGLSAWTAAAFCVGRQPELDGDSPAEAMRGGGRSEEILLAADRAIAELTR